MQTETVWDYPRPPCVEDSVKHIQVLFNGVVIADTQHARRVLEMGHPPVYYIPPDDIRIEHFTRTPRATVCEWKGQAVYFTITIGEKQAVNAAWSYPNPTPDFISIKDYVAFYPQAMGACFVDGERVTPQPGRFYGGWITSAIVGPFTGEPGSEHR